MNESICVVKTPERCEECDFCTVFMGKHYCPPKGTVVIKGERDCGCLLVAVPETMDLNRARGAYNMAYTNGWNAFREKIIGKWQQVAVEEGNDSVGNKDYKKTVE